MYFLVWILLGSFVLLNLLLVIILDAYVEVAEEIKQEELEEQARLEEERALLGEQEGGAASSLPTLEDSAASAASGVRTT